MIAKCLSMSMHMTVCSKMFEAQKEQKIFFGYHCYSWIEKDKQ